MSEVAVERGRQDDRVPALRKAVTILRLVAQRGRLSLAEIVAETGLNKSTAFYLLGTLCSLEVLVYEEEGRSYLLGPTLVELGVAANEQMTDLGVAKRYLTALLDIPNVTVTISTRVDVEHTLLIDKIERLHRPRITFPLGSPVSVLTGAAGRAYLAYDDPTTVARVLEGGLPHHTPRSIVDPEQFMDSLADVRQRGWAIDDEGYIVGVTTLAAPIFAASGDIKLVGSAVGFSNGFDEAGIENCGSTLRQLCDRIGQVLAGGIVPGPPDMPWLVANGNSVNGNGHPVVPTESRH
jgi:DNA-binding IclR family transcriptional regulator